MWEWGAAQEPEGGEPPGRERCGWWEGEGRSGGGETRLWRLHLADDEREGRDEVDAVGGVQRQRQRAVVHADELGHRRVLREVLRAGLAHVLQRLRGGRRRLAGGARDAAHDFEHRPGPARERPARGLAAGRSSWSRFGSPAAFRLPAGGGHLS